MRWLGIIKLLELFCCLEYGRWVLRTLDVTYYEKYMKLVTRKKFWKYATKRYETKRTDEDGWDGMSWVGIAHHVLSHIFHVYISMICAKQ